MRRALRVSRRRHFRTQNLYDLFAPPYKVTESELRNIVEAIKRAYDNFEKEFDVKPTGQLHDLVYP
jgi:adenosylmethionine-8-amino-7-oxononanoate aminotransferase